MDRMFYFKRNALYVRMDKCALHFYNNNIIV